jgi:hypothetical protein
MKKYLALLIIALIISIFFNLFGTKGQMLDSVFVQVKDVSVSDSLVTAKGSWVSSSPDGLFGKGERNSVRIVCDKSTNTCEEVQAKLSNISVHGLYLFEYVNTYEIKEWDNYHLKAELVGLGRIFEIVINFNDKSASFTARDNPENNTASDSVETAQLKGGLEN